MSDVKEIQSVKSQLVIARQKHTEAKQEVTSLRSRVGSSSFQLSDAKNKRFHAKAEVTRLEGLLRRLGVPASEITRIGVLQPETVTTA